MQDIRLHLTMDPESFNDMLAFTGSSTYEHYGVTPVLIETFRYTGAVYRASGWVHVGTTQGRGRYDRDRRYDKPRKDIWLRPLRNN